MMQLTADLIRMAIDRRVVAVDRILARLMVRRGCGGVGGQGCSLHWLGPGALPWGFGFSASAAWVQYLAVESPWVSRVTEDR